MDLPFMLRLGLESLRGLDTDHCQQILIVPDGWGDDGGAGLREVANEFDDPRIEFVDLSWRDYKLIRAMKPPGSAATHWMLVVNGTKAACCEYAFLHDADAFFLEKGSVERQYDEALRRGMVTLGVTPRWDPFFKDVEMTIPGTWELMYSVRWARSRPPYALKGRAMPTAHGWQTFDSMLHAQYLDYETGRVGVMHEPPAIVHFNGTIFAYRTYRDRRGESVCDELFRVLLLAAIETALDVPASQRALPEVAELAQGLTDSTAPVFYTAHRNRVGYAEFRCQVEQLCATPVFSGSRAEAIVRALKPFDEHFEYDPGAAVEAAMSVGETITVGIS
jgi:hypothetical protein